MKISGYASRFGERDAGGDIVRPGAFAASLLERRTPLPMLSDHQRPIGQWTRAFEDQTGLRVEGDVEDAAVKRLIRSGRVNGLSIGFKTRRSHGPKGRRDLLDIDLREVSVVAFPLLGSARIQQFDDTETRTQQQGVSA